MTTTRDRLLDAARELQAKKEKSLLALVDAFEDTQAAADRLTEAQRLQELRMKEAFKAGWSAAELATIGFDPAGSPKPARKASRAKKGAAPNRIPPAAATPPAPAEPTT